MSDLIIIGASGHGKVLADIAKMNGYENISFLDDNSVLKNCGQYKVLGDCSLIDSLDCDFIVGIGDAFSREKIQNTLKSKNKKIITLIHPFTNIAADTQIGVGSVVMAGAVINSGSIIGEGCIINTCASVDHDNTLENFVHVSVGAHLAGNVTVGTRTWIGIGAVASNNINITRDCLIGAGAVVVKNIKVSGTYCGVPARLK